MTPQEVWVLTIRDGDGSAVVGVYATERQALLTAQAEEDGAPLCWERHPKNPALLAAEVDLPADDPHTWEVERWPVSGADAP